MTEPVTADMPAGYGMSRYLIQYHTNRGTEDYPGRDDWMRDIQFVCGLQDLWTIGKRNGDTMSLTNLITGEVLADRVKPSQFPVYLIRDLAEQTLPQPARDHWWKRVFR